MDNESANLWIMLVSFGDKNTEWGYYLGLQNSES